MDTIVAISTAPGMGGIGIIRMSGIKAFDILLKMFKSNKIKTKEDIIANTINYGHIIGRNGEVIDEVMVSFFKTPNSYTKEDIVEINTHGGTVVMQKILKECVANGAKLAESGEFTKRAFLNGRIDLTQVEAVSSLLGAKSEKELSLSNKLLEGRLYDKIQKAKKDILELLMFMEVNIDYPEYDVEEIEEEKIKKVLKNVLSEFKVLKDTFDIGDKVRDGISLAIIGKPNSGKSSFLNFILDKERAIVTDIAGTTRDSIEEYINISGFPVKIIDTAGIRHTDEKVEQIGIKRAIQFGKDSDILISIFDISQPLSKEDYQILEISADKNVIYILNKSDLKKAFTKEEFVKEVEKSRKTKNKEDKYIILETSVLEKEGTDDILLKLEQLIKEESQHKDNELIIIHERQKDVIERTIENIEKSIQEIGKVPIDILSLQIQEIINNLNELTGENVREEILIEIFSNFCLGK